MVVTRQQTARAQDVFFFDFPQLERDLRVNQNAEQLYFTCLGLQKLWPELSPQQKARVRVIFRWKVVNDDSCDWEQIKNQFRDSFLGVVCVSRSRDATKPEMDIITSFLDEVRLSVTTTQRLCVVLELYDFIIRKQDMLRRAFRYGTPAFQRLAQVMLKKFDYLKVENPHMAQILDNNFKEHIDLVKSTYPHVCA